MCPGNGNLLTICVNANAEAAFALISSWPLGAKSHRDRGLAVTDSLASPGETLPPDGEMESWRANWNSGQDEPVPSRRRFSYPRDSKNLRAARLGTNGPTLTNCVSLRMTRNVSTVQNESAAPACTECEGGCRSFHLPLRFRAEGPTQRSACLQRVRCTIEGTRKCVGVPGNARAGNRRAVPLPRA